MNKLIPVLAIALATTACVSHKVQYRNPTAQAAETKSAKQSFFLWGLVGGSEVNLQQMCPGGVAAIESKHGVGDHMLTWLTGGLYSPMSVNVTCAAGTVATGGAQ